MKIRTRKSHGPKFVPRGIPGNDAADSKNKNSGLYLRDYNSTTLQKGQNHDYYSYLFIQCSDQYFLKQLM